MKESFVKRGRLEIIYEILSVSLKPVQKTRILYRCNLSYDQIQKYLKFLISRRLLSSFEKNRKEFFQITSTKKEFLEGYEHLRNFVKSKQNGDEGFCS